MWLSKRDARSNLALAACFGCLILASCAGGGGSTPPVPVTVSAAPVPTWGLYYDTGKTGNVGVPAPASFGPAPAPTQLANASSPRFSNLGDATAAFPSNLTFPALSTSLEFNATGLAAVTPNQGATVTVVNMSETSRTLQLVIPSVNVNATIFQNNPDLNADEGVTTNLSYVVLGSWGTGTEVRWPWLSPAWQEDVTQFAFGFETPVANMPVSGSANYNGSAFANVFRSDSTIRAAIVLGQASLSVDFASGHLSGVLDNWQQATADTSTPSFQSWNDVSLSADIAAGTSRFAGTTAAASNPGTMFSLGGSATGDIVGGFYGPAAEEIGAVWSLSDGAISAIGGVMGQR